MFKPKNGEYLDIFEPDIYGQLISNKDSLAKTILKYGDDSAVDYIRGKVSSFALFPSSIFFIYVSLSLSISITPEFISPLYLYILFIIPQRL